MTRNKPFEYKKKVILVSTPIGNLSDISLRAIESLKQADIICCEDTRVSEVLLNKYEIKHPRLISLYSQNEIEKSKKLLDEVDSSDLVLCYVSDAGTPGISDPGSILIQQAIQRNIPVSFIPGPTSSISALIMSGFDTSRFTFIGFISKKYSQMVSQITQYRKNKETLIFFATALNIKDFITASFDALGERNICVCRELTKIHEEYIRGTNKELKDTDLSFIKGECVVVIEGNKNEFDEMDLLKLKNIISQMKKEKLTNKSIVNILLKMYPDKKNMMYELVQNCG